MYTQLTKKSSWINEQDNILQNGEPGYDLKEHVLKIGNGEDKWSDLTPALSLSLKDSYDGTKIVSEMDEDFVKPVAARVIFQDNLLQELAPGQRVTLQTKGDLMIGDIKVEANGAFELKVPVWDKSFKSTPKA